MSLPIGFFAPLPLPMMIPFMGIQSAVMAQQFGTMFQYGKRKISAMSNEDFNKLTPEQIQVDLTRQLQGMIPTMEQQIQAMQPMVKIIIKEFAEYITLATEALPSVVQGGLGNVDQVYTYIDRAIVNIWDALMRIIPNVPPASAAPPPPPPHPSDHEHDEVPPQQDFDPADPGGDPHACGPDKYWDPNSQQCIPNGESPPFVGPIKPPELDVIHQRIHDLLNNLSKQIIEAQQLLQQYRNAGMEQHSGSGNPQGVTFDNLVAKIAGLQKTFSEAATQHFEQYDYWYILGH